ncbi:hypothetical protein BCV72DRAFT_142588 [Rhizopus microsporus var. microsporus]|uniref:PHD-type domain-containing protein n=2 Tax=Rhizopus microsporus TaxID=58291 RepID=A0A2G4SXX5_RHIZD|nr:uncharacterized protein RHIMIDRAFT_281733 [Rhizopus microsporus ATCC 52813]ORE05211.1 hypothetical protein BCV72DRAFT_142588 [Rhizopus microsporus var. microsporus]PHZ13226.1 hypothetical protein RHIMIDRAFT_281733 [Rhizopus microsporus ATCC 52813]
MNEALPNITELRNNIDFASISQFFHTFQSAFHPWPTSTQQLIYRTRIEEGQEYVFETEDLERMFLDYSERSRLEDLIVRMLRLLTRNRFINSSTWQTYFAKEFDKREPDMTNPFYNQQESIQTTDDSSMLDFFQLSLETRVHLLYLLCEWQLDDPERFREHLDSEEGSAQWRVDPIGYDSKGATLWLFDDNRLYMETPKPSVKLRKKKSRPAYKGTSRKSSRRAAAKKEPDQDMDENEQEWIPWKLICYSKQDWEQIASRYEHSDHADEKRFYNLLINDLVPKVLPILEEREREIKKQEAIIHRKRSSRIMIRELEALERASSSEPEFDFSSPGVKTRSSNRIEQNPLDKERKEKENLAKAREERALERERRLMEREYRALIREKGQDENNREESPMVEERIANDNVKKKRKEKFDEYGNPIPKKKRGRKPKNKSAEDWFFSCICGVSGRNLDDGTPMIACEKCDTWQHIQCLQRSGQVDKNADQLEEVSFICQSCSTKEEDMDIDIEEHDDKQKVDASFVNTTPLNYSIQTPQPVNILPSHFRELRPNLVTEQVFPIQSMLLHQHTLQPAPPIVHDIQHRSTYPQQTTFMPQDSSTTDNKPVMSQLNNQDRIDNN